MSKKRPKFFARPAQLFKDSLLGGDSEPVRSGHFLASGLATKRPNFNSTFFNFKFICFEIRFKLGPHFGHESWPPLCLGGAVWSGGLGNHFGDRLGGSSGELWGWRAGDMFSYFWGMIWNALWKPFNHFEMTTGRRHNHNPLCRYKKKC